MKLLPLGFDIPSEFDDGFWVEKPGYPRLEASWIHPPRHGFPIPEFVYEDGHHRTRSEPGAILCIGTGDDCQVRIPGNFLPARICCLRKISESWVLEALQPDFALHLNNRALEVGCPINVGHGDVIALQRPPTPFAYTVDLSLDHAGLEGQQRNKYPYRLPFRSSMMGTPPAPEELRRLAWETDQMRKGSEEYTVGPRDWSKFSQYVKKKYYKHGIECVAWSEIGRHKPVEEKPASLAPRPLPGWIADLLGTERPLPGLSDARQLPFVSSLELSSRDGAKNPPARLCVQPQSSASTHHPSRDSAAANGTAAFHHSQPAAALSARSDYHDAFMRSGVGVDELHVRYVVQGRLHESFFHDFHVVRLGHRRLFERWFVDMKPK
eukprot:TRINITY_DN27114_c0_g1_i1.p1 TRINITY_DN27114_c0_g1~~TRINITY_DN27114_c0_g1_i1.p1  ORF type:complete len:380 (-),score=36.37 TRINITY_DN27114_c0_g1_i1:47-1186(-)